MLVPKIFPSQLQHQERSLDEVFSLLVWNIHKENQELSFKQNLDELLQNYPSDFLLFQEVKYPKNFSFSLKEYSYALSSNIETEENIFGVITASKTSFIQIKNHLSIKKEAGFTTHKSAVITKHHLSNSKTLYIVNLHAINFVPIDIFKSELAHLKEKLDNYDGALILAGDFNSWSQERVSSLELLQKELSLKKADVNNKQSLLHMFSFPIDHVFYRGLELLDSQVIDTKKVSDHNPIYVKFTIK